MHNQADTHSAWRRELARAYGRDSLLHVDVTSATSIDLTRAHPSGMAQLMAGRSTRLSSLFRDANVFSSARKNARSMRLATQSLSKEHHVSTGFVVRGLAHWDEDNKSQFRTPVLMYPAVVNDSDDPHSVHELQIVGDPIVNDALLSALDERSAAPDHTLLDVLLAETDSFNPDEIFSLIKSAAQQSDTLKLGDFAIADSIVAGVFLDVVPPLLKELDASVQLETTDTRGTTALISQLIAQGPEVPDRTIDLRDGMNLLAPIKRLNAQPGVFALDDAQYGVVDAVDRGRSIRVAATAGSGATQVIAEITAKHVGRGERVLILAPERRDIVDLADRLSDAGLSDLLTDVTNVIITSSHDGPHEPEPDVASSSLWWSAWQAITGAGSDDIEEADDNGTGERDDRSDDSLREALAAGDDLTRHLVAQRIGLASRDNEWGVSVQDCFVKLAGLTRGPNAPGTRLKFNADTMRRLAPIGFDALAHQIAEAAERGLFTEKALTNPWWGAHLTTYDAVQKASQAVTRLNGGTLKPACEQLTALAASSGLTEPRTLSDCQLRLNLLIDLRETFDVFLPSLFERPISPMVEATTPHRPFGKSNPKETPSSLTWSERRDLKKFAREHTRPGAMRDNLHELLVEADAQQHRWNDLARPNMKVTVPPKLTTAAADLRAVMHDVEIVTHAFPSQEIDLRDMSFDELIDRIAELAVHDPVGDNVPGRLSSVAKLKELGLGTLMDDFGSRNVGAAKALDEFTMCWWVSLLDLLLESTVLPMPDEDLMAARLDAEESIRVVTSAAIDRSGDGVAFVVTPMRLPNLQESTNFDVVVICSAHAVAVPEAVVALSKGRQAVIIGDPDGLMVDVLTDDMPATKLHTLQRSSVFDASAAFLPVASLTGQYRMPAQFAPLLARIPERMVASPTATMTVDQVSIPSGVTVAAEIAHVAQLVIDHARGRPDRSLAVVTLSRSHARRVADAVRQLLRDNRDVLSFFTPPAAEPFVVTDAWRSSDVVRDCVIVSLGLSLGPEGRPLGALGPIDTPGIDRALATVVSRAREHLTVASVFAPDDVMAGPRSGEGARAVRSTLMAVQDKSWYLPSAAHTEDDEFTNPLLAEFADLVTARGARLLQPNKLGWPSLVVRRPDGVLVALMGDGISSQRGIVPLSVSEGAVLEQVVADAQFRRMLENRGWPIVWVSSLDLFVNGPGVLDKVFDMSPDTL